MTDTRSPADILREAKALISDPEKWWKGSWNDPKNKKCMCVLAAIYTASRSDVRGEEIKWKFLRPEIPSGFEIITDFNDHPDTTHADIMAFMDSAIANAEAAQ